MRKIITGVIAVAMLAVPTVANAAVNVDNTGAGFVGKGDVQNALGGLTDAQMQTMHEANGVKFANGGYDFIIDYTVTCSKITSTGVQPAGTFHKIVTTPITQEVSATANENKAGKLTNGWNLTGQTATVGKSTITGGCPATIPGAMMVFESGTTGQKTIYGPATSGLKVNGVDLPNTPVEVVAPVT